MAYKTQYQGTNVQDFVNMEWSTISHMTKKELWDFSRRAVVAANKRVNNMYKALGEYSPGVRNFLDGSGGGKVSMNMTANQMRSSIANLRNFMAPPAAGEMTTKTLSGYKKYLKTYDRILGEQRFSRGDETVTYAELPEDDRRSMWNFIDSARSQTGYGNSKEQGSDAFIKTLTEMWARVGQPQFERGQDATTVVSQEELFDARDTAAQRYQQSLRENLEEIEDFDSWRNNQ